jgi:hypothetical protein
VLYHRINLLNEKYIFKENQVPLNDAVEVSKAPESLGCGDKCNGTLITRIKRNFPDLLKEKS